MVRRTLLLTRPNFGVDVGRLVMEALGDEIALGGNELVELRWTLRLGRARVPMGGRAHEPSFGSRARDIEEPPLLGALSIAHDVRNLVLGRGGAPVGDVALVLAQPPRKRGGRREGIVPGTVVGEDARRLAPGQSWNVHGVELEALGLVDGHHLHGVILGGVELGDVFFGVVEELEILDERR